MSINARYLLQLPEAGRVSPYDAANTATERWPYFIRRKRRHRNVSEKETAGGIAGAGDAAVCLRRSARAGAGEQAAVLIL